MKKMNVVTLYLNCDCLSNRIEMFVFLYAVVVCIWERKLQYFIIEKKKKKRTKKNLEIYVTFLRQTFVRIVVLQIILIRFSERRSFKTSKCKAKIDSWTTACMHRDWIIVFKIIGIIKSMTHAWMYGYQ